MNCNDHDIRNEEVILREDNAVVLEFVIPATCDFFDGHFPQYKLLPAVAQFEVITRFSRKYFGTQRYGDVCCRLRAYRQGRVPADDRKSI